MAGAAAAIGAWLVVWPFVGPMGSWSWPIETTDDLAEATVNAELRGVGDVGAILARRGDRRISLISPPLALADRSNRTLRVRAARPDVPAGAEVDTHVVILWQAEPVAGFHYVETTVRLGAAARSVDVGLPAPAARMHRVGVMFPEIAGPVAVGGISFPALTGGERLAAAWASLWAPEPFRKHALNFLRGPAVLGHGLNRYLAGAVCLMAAGWIPVCAARGARLRARAVVIGALAAWVVSDIVTVVNFSRQARAEAAMVAGVSGDARVAAIEGEAIAWAAAVLREPAERGTFVVLSDDPFTPAFRIGYLVEPGVRRVDDWRTADWIVVVEASRARFDPAAGLFAYGAGEPVAARQVAALSEGTYVLRRVDR